jgi:pyridoxamine 5'-phosphate oxidase
MSVNYNYRKEYGSKRLDLSDLSNDPFDQFGKWFSEAMLFGIEEPNAMILSTTGLQNRPSSRIVLLKDCTFKGLTFFTNYNSKKGKQLGMNPYASLLFPWYQMERQVRIEGKVEFISQAESDIYFESRPEGSKLSAWISPQSEEIISGISLETKSEEIARRFQNKIITRPPYWGGYIFIPDLFEFWQGRENRLHDRFEYISEHGNWKIRRLAP